MWQRAENVITCKNNMFPLAKLARVTSRVQHLAQEVQREAHKCVGFFQMGRMTALLEYH